MQQVSSDSRTLRAIAALLPRLSPEQSAPVLASMHADDLERLARTWQLHARPLQLRPDDGKQIWTLRSGRGAGKTRSASEDTLDLCEDWGARLNGAIVSKSVGDVRSVMIEGVSGLQACAQRRGYHVRYFANQSVVKHPSGAVLHVMSAESPEFGRGPNLNFFWADEVGAWPTNALSRLKEFLFAWRMPSPAPHGKPIGTITMTPKPNAISRWVLRDPDLQKIMTVVGEPTTANRDNIDITAFYNLFNGTRLGRQELEGALLDDEDATLNQDTIHRNRLASPPEIDYIVIAVDPAVTANENSDDTGIVVIGCVNKHAYVLADHTMQRAAPSKWGRRIIDLYRQYDAHAIVIETNNGGDLVRTQLEVATEAVRAETGEWLAPAIVPVFAAKSKRARAEPIAALYEQNRVHHIGFFPELERELTEWVPGGPSPNRLDALVWGVSHVLLDNRASRTLIAYDCD